MNHKTILVIGATGLLGEPVARQLRADGYRVRVFTRSPEKARARFGPGFEIVTGGVEDMSALKQALRGCAGVHINLYDGRDPDLERRGASAVAQAAAQSGVQRVTYLSGSTVSEANRWYAGTEAKWQAEAALRQSGVPFTVFRAAAFMESLPRYVRGNRARYIGSQPHLWHWVAAADYARMVSKACADPRAANKILYVHGPQALTLRDALETYGRIVHPTLKVSRLPIWMASLMATLFRVQALAEALPFIRYAERVREEGDPAEANALLGAPTTTLEQWSRAQALSAQSRAAPAGAGWR